MQVFKVYFKIIRKNIPQMSIYFLAFLLFAVLLTQLAGSDSNKGYSDSKSKIAFLNYDNNSQFVDGLKQYLSQNSNIINIKNDTQSLQDALFFRKVEYIVKIPQGFTESFLSGKKNILLEKTIVPGSTSAVFMDLLINKYLNIASLYIKNLPDITQKEIVSNIESDLKLKSSVDVLSFRKTSPTNKVSYYFKYLAYSIMAILILGVTSIMLVFNDIDLKRRNMSSPISSINMNIQLILGNLSFALVVWAIMIIISILIYRKTLLNQNIVLLCINSLIFTILCLSLSFFIGNIIKSRNAQSAVANVFTLGSCFIGGVFVPQEFLGNTVKSIASFTPTYWYVKAIDDLNKLVDINITSYLPVIYSMLIQLGFALALLATSLVLTKQKRAE